MAVDWTTLAAAAKTTEGSIRNWLNRDDIPVTNILIEAQADIYQHLRVREMMVIDAGFTFAISTSSKALPSDFLDPIQFIPWEWGVELPLSHEQSFKAPRDSAGALLSGSPSRWRILGSTAYVDATCDAAFGGELVYYGLPTVLSVSNTTNFLTVRYPSLLRYACMAKAYEHMKQAQGATQYLQMMMGAIGAANASNEMFRRSMYAPS